MTDEQQLPRPEIPERVAHLMDEPALAAAHHHTINIRRETARQITRLLDYREERQREVASDHIHFRRVTVHEANRHAALLLETTEQTATAILNAAEQVRDHLPMFWKAFRCGAVDLPKLRKTAVETTPLINRDDLLAIIDNELVEVAPGKTPTELRSWILRRIPQLDVELFNEAAEEAKERRYVSFHHGGDGMSLVELFIPTLEAQAIEKKVHAAARGMNRQQPKDTDQPPIDGPHSAAVKVNEATLMDHDARHQDHASRYQPEDPEYPGDEGATDVVDDRTIRQREADLLSAWLRDGHCYTTPISAKICVMVPEETLTGESDQPAISADRASVIPAADIRKMAADPDADHHWYTAASRKNATKADRDILSVTYNGRFAPERLRDAIIFRDGICQATGCTTGAERCDLDHQIPYERAGPTTGSNLWALCRRHHRLKSHGYLPPPNSAPQAPHHKAA